MCKHKWLSFIHSRWAMANHDQSDRSHEHNNKQTTNQTDCGALMFVNSWRSSKYVCSTLYYCQYIYVLVSNSINLKKTVLFKVTFASC